MMKYESFYRVFGLFIALTAVVTPTMVLAEDIAADRVTLRGVDKITGRVSTMDVKVGEETEFGRLKIVVEKCWTKPIEETPENSAFLRITERHGRENYEPVFTGWMFSSNPALSAMEDPIYDVWVLSCSSSEKPAEASARLVEPVTASDGQVIVGDLDEPLILETPVTTIKFENMPEEAPKADSGDLVIIQEEVPAVAVAADNIEAVVVEEPSVEAVPADIVPVESSPIHFGVWEEVKAPEIIESLD